ncbi:MAG: LysM peptidoglycan-binding domain-containing protein [Mobilicoccus sp.]|nr:LysM peptidoglycan-binding domain-containing protein [Mobilicoccus sp.]
MTVSALSPTGDVLGIHRASSAIGATESLPGGGDSRPGLRVVGEHERLVVPPLRLTRRGRLVRTLVVFGIVSLLALMAFARLTAPQLPPTHVVTVQPGQTLTQIAGEALPMVPLDAAVVRIQMANGLNGSILLAGQEIVIPGE